VILEQMGSLEVFVGHPFVRVDERPRGLARAAFPLPPHFERPFGESFARLLAGLAPFFLAADPPLPSLELLLCEAQLPRRSNRLPLRIGREGDHAHLTAHLFVRGCLGQGPLHFQGQLDVRTHLPV
jgi:hypothetical protein